ncbi:MAG: hypothetical protein ACRC7O_06890 [Fimbriiglobus sp.]
MPLIELELPTSSAGLPADVRAFLRDADDRIDAYRSRVVASAFVPSDYVGAYGVLRGLAGGVQVRGNRFCEWGSGFGVVATLAAMLEFDSCGIEADAELVTEARRLADDFDTPVEFIHGSFVPPGAETRLHTAGTYSWMTTEADHAYDELGLDVADMDVVFAYPWPDEEAVTADLFARYAGPGAVLVTYTGGDGFRARRFVRPKRRGR